jgi:hypothetical protein
LQQKNNAGNRAGQSTRIETASSFRDPVLLKKSNPNQEMYGWKAFPTAFPMSGENPRARSATPCKTQRLSLGLRATIVRS